LIALGPGKFFAATGIRKTIFRLIPVPAGKNPERLQPEARDIFRLPGINPPGHPGRIFAEAGVLPVGCMRLGRGLGW